MKIFMITFPPPPPSDFKPVEVVQRGKVVQLGKVDEPDFAVEVAVLAVEVALLAVEVLVLAVDVAVLAVEVHVAVPAVEVALLGGLQ